MAFSFLVCALFLLAIVYFAGLVTGEIAFWLIGRVSNSDRKPMPALSAQH